jgi:hypothetical protein
VGEFVNSTLRKQKREYVSKQSLICLARAHAAKACRRRLSTTLFSFVLQEKLWNIISSQPPLFYVGLIICTWYRNADDAERGRLLRAALPAGQAALSALSVRRSWRLRHVKAVQMFGAMRSPPKQLRNVIGSTVSV